MKFDKSRLFERLENREFDFLIYKNEINENIFNNEIIFNLIHLTKKEVPDFVAFYIAAMGSTGSDEFEMVNTELKIIDEVSMLKIIDKFQTIWNLDLGLKEYINDKIIHIYEVNIDPKRVIYDSEISFAIETNKSYIYFFTSHFYY